MFDAVILSYRSTIYTSFFFYIIVALLMNYNDSSFQTYLLCS